MIKALYYYYWFMRTLSMRRNFPKYQIEPVEETIADIIANKKSISRFGDGEFRLIMQERAIVFQNLEGAIASRLHEVITSNVENLIIGLPEPLVRRSRFKRNSKIHWLHFINQYGGRLEAFLDKERIYGNSFISRFYITYSDRSGSGKIAKMLKKIWDKKPVLIIEGEFSRLGIGNDLFDNALDIKRLICPATNAFSKYDDIFNAIKNHGKDKLIILALGPTATVLSYDLARLNFWALDLGHIDIEYMWMKMAAPEKISIAGKYISESDNSKGLELLPEFREQYENEIVARITND